MVSTRLQSSVISTYDQETLAHTLKILPPGNTGSFFLTNYYSSHSQTSLTNEIFRSLVQYQRSLLCGDLNARHIATGSSKTNSKGFQLIHECLDSNLVIHNSGINTRTNQYNNSDETLDYVISTPDLTDYIVSVQQGDDLNSDHYSLITKLNFMIPPNPLRYKRNPKNTDWDLFNLLFEHNLQKCKVAPVLSPSSLDSTVEYIVNSINDAFTKSCPEKPLFHANHKRNINFNQVQKKTTKGILKTSRPSSKDSDQSTKETDQKKH